MIAAESIATHLDSSNRHSTVIRIRGKNITVPSIEIEGRRVIVTGKVLKVAQVFDEELVEGEAVSNPSTFIATLQASRLKADLLTFAQRPPDTTPKFNEPFEWDNWAVVPVTTFEEWWKDRLPRESRKNVRRAGRCGVVVRSVPFDDELVSGIRQRIRVDCSPRHVPDEIHAIPEIPRTLSGKILEVPVKRILMGEPPERVASRDALANPQALDWFVEKAKR